MLKHKMSQSSPAVIVLAILTVSSIGLMPGGWPTACVLVACLFGLSYIGGEWIRSEFDHANKMMVVKAQAEEDVRNHNWQVSAEKNQKYAQPPIEPTEAGRPN